MNGWQNEGQERARLRALIRRGDAEAVLDVVLALQRRLDAQATQLGTQAAQLGTQEARLLKADQDADDAQDKIRRLEDRLKYLTRLLFGRRSEKLTHEELGQLLLAFDGELDNSDDDPLTPTPPVPNEASEVGDDAQGPGSSDGPTTKPRPNHRGRTRLSEALFRCIDIQRVPDDQRACPLCERGMACNHYRDHETLEYIPARFVVHVQRREILGCQYADCKGGAVTAPRADASSDTRLGASVIAHLIESKADDALPIYRQCDQFQRLGVDIPLNTLYSNWNYGLDTLLPVATATLSDVLDGEIVAIDDTGMPVLETGKGGSKFRGHLWGFRSSTSRLVAFEFTKTWTADEVSIWIQAIGGFIQVDDYKGYSSEVDLQGHRI